MLPSTGLVGTQAMYFDPGKLQRVNQPCGRMEYRSGGNLVSSAQVALRRSQSCCHTEKASELPDTPSLLAETADATIPKAARAGRNHNSNLEQRAKDIARGPTRADQKRSSRRQRNTESDFIFQRNA